MSALHTVNKSPYERNSLAGCTRLAVEGDEVLLMEDGIYGALKAGECAGLVSDAMGKLSFYVLGPDLKARGIGEDKLIDGIKVVGYDDFVDLVEKHGRTQAWL